MGIIISSKIAPHDSIYFILKMSLSTSSTHNNLEDSAKESFERRSGWSFIVVALLIPPKQAQSILSSTLIILPDFSLFFLWKSFREVEKYWKSAKGTGLLLTPGRRKGDTSLDLWSSTWLSFHHFASPWTTVLILRLSSISCVVLYLALKIRFLLGFQLRFFGVASFWIFWKWCAPLKHQNWILAFQTGVGESGGKGFSFSEFRRQSL